MVAINNISPPVASPTPDIPKSSGNTAPLPQSNAPDEGVNISLSDQAKGQSTPQADNQKNTSSEKKSENDSYFEQLAKAQTEKRAEEIKQARRDAERAADQLKVTVDYLAHLAYAKTAAEQPINSEPFPPQPEDILTKLNLIA